jgi:hypothetical protein
MKNIHLIPTDNYSQLVNSTSKYGGLFLSKYYSPMKDMGDSYQNIYITNSEEIKEGVDQWYLDKVLNEPYNSGGAQYSSNQDVIILTTDQDLDGVQAIDDEFLEWFVRNPSCESVEVIKDLFQVNQNNPVLKGSTTLVKQHRIIIPQEEPKQDYSGVHLRHCYQGEYEDGCKYSEDDCPAKPLQEPKQETFEEAAERYAHNYFNMHETNNYKALKQGYEAGAKEMAERMYSKEEVKEALLQMRKTPMTFVPDKRMYSDEEVMNALHSVELKYNKDFTKIYEGMKEWFEQNKKK